MEITLNVPPTARETLEPGHLVRVGPVTYVVTQEVSASYPGPVPVALYDVVPGSGALAVNVGIGDRFLMRDGTILEIDCLFSSETPGYWAVTMEVEADVDARPLYDMDPFTPLIHESEVERRVRIGEWTRLPE